MKIFEFESVRYFYPGAEIPALNNISFSIHRGEFVLLLGPSGGGKSTAARVLAGLIPKYYGGRLLGNVHYRGQPLSECKEFRQHVGIVFQNPERQILAHEVENEIVLGMENLGFPPQEMKQRLEQVLSLLSLGSIRFRRTDELSGGEKQKVILGAILAMGPGTLILDEPTSQLDPDGAVVFLSALQKLHRDLGYTIILIEHRTNHCFTLADRVLFFDQGRLTADATASTFAEIAAEKQSCYLPRTASRISHSSTREKPASAIETKVGISARNLSFSYAGHAPVITGVNIDIPKGCVTAIIGDNGAGKSTLLKLFAGLLKPSDGEISVSGKPINFLLPREKVLAIGYLPQQPDDFLFNDTVEEELQFSLRGADVLDHSRVEEVLRLFNLESLRSKHPRALSIGERERVALASVWITAHQILLLDEPTRGTSPDRRSFWAAMFRQYVSNSNRTVVCVSQDMDFVAECADYILILKDGILRKYVSPVDLTGDTSAVESRLAPV
ncbi:MAG: ATP-binding cassette domain-containing protein [Candidatus Omnitrophica bacterium]|nr:ATP-binding cassette domain-containing protein [Candidatus Omnitrophota bacterium]